MEDKSKIPILKVGDKIRIKSKEWFDSQDKTVLGSITPPKGQAAFFVYEMSKYCGGICTIKAVVPHSNNTVKVDENPYNWGTWMFDLVDEEKKLSNNKDNDSQSNSSKFDLTKVIYRARRIR